MIIENGFYKGSGYNYTHAYNFFVRVSPANARKSEASALMHAMWLVFPMHGNSVAKTYLYLFVFDYGPRRQCIA